MKKYIIYLFAIGALLSSCSKDYLDEETRGKLTPDGFFQNADDLELGLIAMYNKVNGMYNEVRYATISFGGDDITTRPGSNKAPFREYDMFNVSDANPWIKWNSAYAAVNAANNVILNYDNAELASEEEREQAAGQAHFVRGLAYYYLVRGWNEIPLILDLEVNLEIGKSSPEDVYEVILQDLQTAENFLPDSWTGLKEGVAPTKGSAKAMLASVYLNMAGYPILDDSKYALAAQKAKEVIDNADTWGYRLLENFADLWTAEKFNDEIVFGLFYDRNSAPWTWENGNMSAPQPGRPQEEGGWDDYFAEINFFNKFPEGPRKDATFQTIIRPNAEDTLHWTEGVQQHPYYHKMRIIDKTNLDTPWAWEDWWSSRTMMISRYADVLLIYAEAQAMSSGGPDGTAYTAVNAVRNRAGLPDLTAGLNQLAFRDSVVMERAWEFAGCEPERTRWYDLVRLERVEEAAADRHPDELEIVNPPDKSDYFAPIPANEKLINPNLN